MLKKLLTKVNPRENFSHRIRHDESDVKDVCTDNHVELAELVLKKNILSFNEKTLKYGNREDFAPLYSILFMA